MAKDTVDMENKETSDSKVYEVSYIILPNFSEEDVLAKVSEMKSKLASLGATLISDENPVLIDLAYQMTRVVQTVRHKADKGYFGWVKFEISSDSISKIKKYFDENADILRHLIIKTVKENTLINGKMKLKTEDKQKRMDDAFEGEETEEVKDEVVEAETDKVEEDLVTA